MIDCYLNWSTGKDACLTLHLLQESKDYRVKKLLTTCNNKLQRVTMHGLSLALYNEQISAINLPAHQIFLDDDISMEAYQNKMEEACLMLKNEGLEHAAFGDIFLEDLRAYRDKQLGKIGIKTLYPLWKKDSAEVAKQIIAAGIKAIVVCINGSLLDKSFCGRLYDEKFLEDLPENVDPCGENGEFHTFCYDGPMFKHPVAFTKGNIKTSHYKNPDGSDKELPFHFQELHV